MSHLTEEQLNLYLDNELSPGERATVEAHLAGCETCRIEWVSLQTLFTALDTLQLETLAADLTPLVLGGMATERQRAIRRRYIGWLGPGLQGVVIILLILFGWSALVMRYGELSRYIPTETLDTTWHSALAQGSILWTATIAQWQTWGSEVTADLLDLPAVLGQTTSQWPQFSGLGLTTPQITTLSLATVLMWLVGNSILLRRAAGSNPGRHPTH